jgi:acyl phosphate:glycerol-3-phosphate acyltransferase
VAGFFAGWANVDAGSPSLEWFKLGAGVAAILGHNYTCWLRFKGGKGIATSAGVLVGLVPLALLIVLGVWIVVFALSRYVSLASITAAIVLPVAVWLLGYSLRLIVAMAALAALAIYKHQSNIKRLMNGTENRITFRKAAPSASPKAAP